MNSSPRNNHKQWRKILYEKQPYPDNYVDEKFLHDLDMIPQSSSPTAYTIFLSTSVVVQQITAVAIFVAIHKFITKHESFFWRLFAFDAYLLILIYMIHRIFSDNNPTLKSTFKSSLLFVICLRVIAPALQTLTSSYSDDTIDALAIIFSSLHLVFHDYAYVNSTKDFSGKYTKESFPGKFKQDNALCYL
jgi:phosphatidylinositol N-acetylglucosaminyltransferase subunit C